MPVARIYFMDPISQVAPEHNHPVLCKGDDPSSASLYPGARTVMIFGGSSCTQTIWIYIRKHLWAGGFEDLSIEWPAQGGLIPHPQGDSDRVRNWWVGAAYAGRYGSPAAFFNDHAPGHGHHTVDIEQ